MELRYMGFEQAQNTRCYQFDRIIKGEPTVRLTITADLALFLEHHVQIQEGPGICAGKLATDLAQSLTGSHRLTNDDLVAHSRACTIADALKSESRRKRPTAPQRDERLKQHYEEPMGTPDKRLSSRSRVNDAL